MKSKIFKKILTSFVVIAIVLCFISPSVSALTSNYASGEAVIKYHEESQSILDKVGNFIQDLLLGALGKAIAAIGWVIEQLLRLVVLILTGNYAFPWADKTIFNSIPLLDVNFINPAKYSLFLDQYGKFTTVGNTVRNIYFTGMSIGLGFFGIIVAVMAIRIAISSIAAEKAKYKEAIVTWITALVLLFALHYIISFVFYMNEQMTEVASTIVTKQLNGASNGSISGMGEKFREKAFGEWNTESFIAAILYCVFIIQSLMFFYAYVKRLFFVVILAVISPFVVVYDFLKKAVF